MGEFYVDGRFVPEEEALVPVTDHGFVYGDAFFEAIGVCQGRVLDLDAHLERFAWSARMMRIPLPAPIPEVRALLLETASRNGLRSAPAGGLRTIVSRGRGPLGVDASDQVGPPTFTIIASAGEDRLTGPVQAVDAVTSTFTRPNPSSHETRIKATGYLTSILAFFEARDRGADIAILRDATGHVAEGHHANVFCVRRGAVCCPPADAGLAGVTRAGVLAAAASLGYPCREAPLTTYDLRCADEAFVTSTGTGIKALRTMDGDELPGPVPGPVTQAVRDAYVERVLDTGVPVP